MVEATASLKCGSAMNSVPSRGHWRARCDHHSTGSPTRGRGSGRLLGQLPSELGGHALDAELIEMTVPDKPKSSKQRSDSLSSAKPSGPSPTG